MKKYNKSLISLALLFIHISCYLKIPFETYYDPKLNDSSLDPEEKAKLLFKNYLQTDIQVGTPFQDLKLNIDLQNPFMNIVGQTQNQTLPGKKFDEGASSTFKKLLTNKEIRFDFVTYQDGLLGVYKADISNETIKFSNNEFKNMTFVDIKGTNNATLVPVNSGIFGVGLSIGMNSEAENSTIVTQLKKKDILDSYFFYFEFTNDKKDQGNLILGAEPSATQKSKKNRYKNSTKCISDDLGFLRWGFKLESFYIENKEKNETYTERKIDPDVLLSIEHNGIVLPRRKIWDDYFEPFFEEYINKSECFLFNDNEMLYYYCKKDADVDYENFPKFSIYSKELNETYEFDYKDLWITYGDINYCLVYFNIIDSRDIYIILGKQYFQKYNSIFYNVDQREVLVYKEKMPKEAIKLHWYYFVIGGLSLVIIGIVIFFIVKIFRRNPIKDPETHGNLDFNALVKDDNVEKS